jgi:prevent-host-death family protein
LCGGPHSYGYVTELPNNTRELLERVKAGEDVIITVAGRPAGVLEPVASRGRWLPRREFAAMAPETTDDLPAP